jgi:hypothetical protein
MIVNAPASTSSDTSPRHVNASPERISQLADALLTRIQQSVADIEEINLQARLLSVNAQIEARRAGEVGRSFDVVAREMVGLSDRTKAAAASLEQQSETVVRELANISRALATQVRGTRLADLAFTNIDLIDRNLYERSCDCRWWATDAALVAALESSDPAACTMAAERMAVILKAYTVYCDIVLADRNGVVVANGKRDAYASQGTQHADAPWFASAMATANGDEFGFQGMHESPLAGGNRVLIYSCKVCRGGDAKNEPLGVLGVVFNWDGLAQKVVDDTPIEPEMRAATQVSILDPAGRVLAASNSTLGAHHLGRQLLEPLFRQKKAAETVVGPEGRRWLFAHALSPGFETYRTGWHSIIAQRIG